MPHNIIQTTIIPPLPALLAIGNLFFLFHCGGIYLFYSPGLGILMAISGTLIPQEKSLAAIIPLCLPCLP